MAPKKSAFFVPFYDTSADFYCDHGCSKRAQNDRICAFYMLFLRKMHEKRGKTLIFCVLPHCGVEGNRTPKE
jgi:hypothetical protein